MSSRSLRDDQILEIWFRSCDEHPLDRALTVLEIADSGEAREELAALSVGERDVTFFHSD